MTLCKFYYTIIQSNIEGLGLGAVGAEGTHWDPHAGSGTEWSEWLEGCLELQCC